MNIIFWCWIDYRGVKCTMVTSKRKRIIHMTIEFLLFFRFLSFSLCYILYFSQFRNTAQFIFRNPIYLLRLYVLGMRRHSLAVSSGNLLQVPKPMAPTSLTEDDTGPVTIDHLSLPKVPNLSRRSSLRSNWSELEALASRRQSEDSITFPEE